MFMYVHIHTHADHTGHPQPSNPLRGLKGALVEPLEGAAGALESLL